MAVHLLPLLLAKVAGKLVAKKAIAHAGHGHHAARHAAHEALGSKVVKDAAQKAAERHHRQGDRAQGPEGERRPLSSGYD